MLLLFSQWLGVPLARYHCHVLIMLYTVKTHCFYSIIGNKSTAENFHSSYRMPIARGTFSYSRREIIGLLCCSFSLNKAPITFMLFTRLLLKIKTAILTCAVDASSCNAGVNNLRSVQKLVSSSKGITVGYANVWEMSGRAWLADLLTVTERDIITRSRISAARITC